MKEDSIKRVLEIRAGVLKRVLKNQELPPDDKNYFEGKLEGYNQAIDLLNESLESTEVELHTDSKQSITCLLASSTFAGSDLI